MNSTIELAEPKKEGFRHVLATILMVVGILEVISIVFWLPGIGTIITAAILSGAYVKAECPKCNSTTTAVFGDKKLKCGSCKNHTEIVWAKAA